MAKGTEEPIYINTTEAAARAGVTRMTITHWCYRYGIGTKVGGRWRIDPFKLNRMITKGSEVSAEEKKAQG